MQVPDAAELLEVWERGAEQPAAQRALLLLESALREDFASLARQPIGARDAMLLELRSALFGAQIRCLAGCARCGEELEIAFSTDEIRAPHAERSGPYALAVGDYALSFRLPCSADLLELSASVEPRRAEELLLARCLLEAQTAAGTVAAEALPAAVRQALSRQMAELDAQAEVLLQLCCPACGQQSDTAFDIAVQLWFEVEAWAKQMLRDVHVLARAYGWSEREILSLSGRRRRRYLELLGA